MELSPRVAIKKSSVQLQKPLIGLKAMKQDDFYLEVEENF